MPIRQELLFECGSQRIFEALTNAEQFGALTDSSAQIDPQPGGQFSCFDGMITGMTIESIPGVRLVQAWRVANWDPGVYSIVKFDFEKVNDLQTKLVFDHTGFPDEHKSHLEQGWHARYWEPMKKFLES